MSTSVSKIFPGSCCLARAANLPQNPNQSATFLEANPLVRPAGSSYYCRIHEYWLIIKVFPAARTLLPGSELLVRIKNGCFLPFTTGDSRLGRPETYYYYLAFEERLPIKVFCRSSSVHGCGSKAPEP